MNFRKTPIALAVALATTLAVASPASAAWRGHGHWHGAGIGAGIGFATGALVGGALAAPYYYGGGYPYGAYAYDDGYDEAYAAVPSYGRGGSDDAYCAQRFRSYDPRSGTYLGYDGMRHPCP
jgi:hypothetical protein